MNKKGFVFIETIVVVAIVLSALITMYSMYILSSNTTLRRQRYDDVNKLYETYYIKKYLSSFHLNKLMDLIDEGSFYEQIYRGRNDLFGDNLKDEELFFETMWEDLHIRSITLMKEDVTPIIRCNNTETEAICNNKNLLTYLKTIDVSGDDDMYRLVFEFSMDMEGNSCSDNSCFYYYTSIKVNR